MRRLLAQLVLLISLLIVTEPTATSLGTIELVLKPFSGVALAHRLTIRSKG